MVVIFKKNNTFIYESKTGLIGSREIKEAEKIYRELSKQLTNLEKNLIRKKLLSRQGQKKDALYIWYYVGKILLDLIKKYNLKDKGEEEFLWKSIYDFIPKTIQKKGIPKRSLDWQRNHFRLCTIMAQYEWNFVKSVGNWSIWREIFDNKKILTDMRVFNWTIKKIKLFNNQGIYDHKSIRQFLYAISKRLKDIDTSLLLDNELINKLEQIKFKLNPEDKSIQILSIK